MNELIEKLAKAHLVRDEHTEFGWQECHKYVFDPEELKKFAELIVKECAAVVFKKTGPKSALDVLEHFGVEE